MVQARLRRTKASSSRHTNSLSLRGREEKVCLRMLSTLQASTFVEFHSNVCIMTTWGSFCLISPQRGSIRCFTGFPSSLHSVLVYLLMASPVSLSDMGMCLVPIISPRWKRRMSSLTGRLDRGSRSPEFSLQSRQLRCPGVTHAGDCIIIVAVLFSAPNKQEQVFHKLHCICL
jgi:hypothetical protein